MPYIVHLKCSTCGTRARGIKKAAGSMLRYHPHCKCGPFEARWVRVPLAVTCPVHPEIEIDNTSGKFCPECFESSERFVRAIMPGNGR